MLNSLSLITSLILLFFIFFNLQENIRCASIFGYQSFKSITTMLHQTNNKKEAKTFCTKTMWLEKRNQIYSSSSSEYKNKIKLELKGISSEYK
ncbi:MAG: hypothetical protein A2381_02715 [Bdellovibrionales bacterium RIFOXYB1_FULL_37_110]|nr:MAG: hypothetical protein A2181_05095 [Bdellovibrionales bacterium RIFOXYA1_FULL_38_20]OFZ52610.1 MAG: hypothetical protein A2417_01050 [Bdellovibrionales bacterium RIFOXYC1_FULL_37_79]OFZ53676.1 MAG: hypothetical protein A2328_04640 [Bdellovibrionales bacterium RIFOXYB2_FULL_36_6]OFZ58300.1 MAG: hypothetical protein A2381_02715 [Bdellovibrionales bacterium RIFOXYB1_FULL_37_110]OFZ65281.1 MAG: hypothetical protein A2577_04000 [Bdellovibrionales bacterium RIFOXYD1_FULL_36_51]